MPEEMHARQAECAAASSDKALSSAAVLADKLLLDVPAADQQPQPTQPAANSTANGTANGASVNANYSALLLEHWLWVP